MDEEELAEVAGRTMLMLAASKDLDKRMFVPSSLLASVTLENIIEGLETIKGSEIAVQLSLQLKKTTSGTKRKFTYLPSKSKKKLLGTHIDELCWPVNPVDSINLLLRKFIPNKDLVEWDDDYYDANEEDKEKRWDEIVTKFWLEAGEPIRQLLVTVYNDEVSGRFSDADFIPVDTSSNQAVPLDTLKSIFDLLYTIISERKYLTKSGVTLNLVCMSKSSRFTIGKLRHFVRQFRRNIVLYTVRRLALSTTQNFSSTSFLRYHPAAMTTQDSPDH